MNANLKSRVKKIEDKLEPEPHEHMLFIWEGKEAEAEEKKKKILAEDANATFFEIHFVWAK